MVIAVVIPCLVLTVMVKVIKEVVDFEVMEVVTYLIFEVVKHLIFKVAKLIDAINSVTAVTTFVVKKLIVTKDSFMVGHFKDFMVLLVFFVKHSSVINSTTSFIIIVVSTCSFTIIRC